MPSARTIKLTSIALFLGVILLTGAWIRAAAQTPSEAQLQEGAELFAENCAMCHGPNGEGRQGATLAQNWPSVRPDLTIRATIERGVEGSTMPAWSQENGGPLTGEQIDALTAYILSWETGEPFTPPEVTQAPAVALTEIPGVEGDPTNGSNLYRENCEVCHGPEGQGRRGATLARNWAGINPGLSIRATISQGIPGSLMPAWGQENGGPLGEEEINDLVAYILTWEPIAVEAAPAVVAPAPRSTFLAGVGMLALGALLFAAIVAVALVAQRKR